MLTISAIRAAMTTAIEAMDPDGRYSIEDSATASSWIVGPDVSDTGYSPSDLQASIRISGGSRDGHVMRHQVAVHIDLANYSGDRTLRGATDSLTSEDRIDGASRHLMEALPAAVDGLFSLRYSDPATVDGGTWISCFVLFSLVRPR